MKGKPIFNEGCLQKIATKGTFMIRNKMSLSKSGSKINRSYKIIENDDKSHVSQIQNCLEIVQKCYHDDEPISKNNLSRLMSLLNSLKPKPNLLQNSSSFQEFQQSGSVLCKQGQNKNRSRKRLQTLQNQRQEMNKQSLISEMIKNKTPKLKLNKQNSCKNPVMLEMKIERIQVKLTQKQNQLEQLKLKYQKCQKDMQRINTQKSDLLSKIDQHNIELKELNAKTSQIVLQKIQNESELNQQVRELQQTLQQTKKSASLLQQRLKERQFQIISLFQLQKK